MSAAPPRWFAHLAHPESWGSRDSAFTRPLFAAGSTTGSTTGSREGCSLMQSVCLKTLHAIRREG